MTDHTPTTGRTARPTPKDETAFAGTMRAALLRPRFSRNPAAMRHVPLLFWLVSALRPVHSLVLGVGEGDLFFALCQALDRLDQSTTCTGINNPASIDSDPQTAQDLREHLRQLYPDLADLRTADDAGAILKGQRKGSVDLLLLDLEQMDGATLPGHEDLMRPLHADGVLMLRGKINPANKALRALTDHPAAIRFRTSTDLVILPQGEAMPAALSPLVSTAPRGEITGDINRLLLRLGEGLEAAARHRQAIEAGETGKPLATLRQSHEQRGQHLSRALVEVFELRTRHARFEDARTETEEQLAAARAMIETLTTELGEARTACDSERKARHATEKELAATQSRKATQGKDDSSTITERESERETRFRETAALTRRLEVMRAENAHLSARVTELLESTSWRITAPMRSVGDNLRQRRRRRATRKRRAHP